MTTQHVQAKSLFEIQQRYQNLFEQLEEAAESENMLEAMQGLDEQLAIDAAEFEDKAEAYAYRIRQFQAQAAFLKAEAKVLADKAKRADAAADRLLERVADALKYRGVKKIDLAHYKLSFRKSEAVEIADEKMIPDCFVRSEIISKVDKTGIKQALKMGEKVAGARLVERQNLQIK